MIGGEQEGDGVMGEVLGNAFQIPRGAMHHRQPVALRAVAAFRAGGGQRAREQHCKKQASGDGVEC